MRAIVTPHAPQNAKIAVPADGGDINALFGNSPANMIWVGGTGDIQIRLDNGQDPTSTSGTALPLTGVVAGVWHFMPPFIHIDDTNTDATAILVGISFGNES